MKQNCCSRSQIHPGHYIDSVCALIFIFTVDDAAKSYFFFIVYYFSNTPSLLGKIAPVRHNIYKNV
jgi:hypothetical protein